MNLNISGVNARHTASKGSNPPPNKNRATATAANALKLRKSNTQDKSYSVIAREPVNNTTQKDQNADLELEVRSLRFELQQQGEVLLLKSETVQNLKD